jgi:hypothetical protein
MEISMEKWELFYQKYILSLSGNVNIGHWSPFTLTSFYNGLLKTTFLSFNIPAIEFALFLKSEEHQGA